MDEVGHIPQTLATRRSWAADSSGSRVHPADMLKPDPRDTLYEGKTWKAAEEVTAACAGAQLGRLSSYSAVIQAMLFYSWHKREGQLQDQLL